MYKNFQDLRKQKEGRTGQVDSILKASVVVRKSDIQSLNKSSSLPFIILSVTPKLNFHSRQPSTTKAGMHKRTTSETPNPAAMRNALFADTLKKREESRKRATHLKLESAILGNQNHTFFSNFLTTKTSTTSKTSDKFGLKDETISKKHFELKYVIGRGGFGKVWKVEHLKSKRQYAMKEMSKTRVLAKKSVSSVMNERQLLSVISSPFIINMRFAFQDKDHLYLVLDFLAGGDLRYHIGKMRKFNEEQTSLINFHLEFFVACIVSGLEDLHSQQIIHRDIKPENLVLDSHGFCRITDLGVARILRADNSSDTSGTPGYMAPEVMCRMNHSFTADYYAVGVIAYEFMLSRRPYMGRSRQEIREAILAKQVLIKEGEAPKNWSIEAIDFINKLLQRKPGNRLGHNGIEEIKQHPWLRDFPWEALKKREYPSPYIPNSTKDNFDKKHAMMSTDDEELLEKMAAQNVNLRRNSVQSQFTGYLYNGKSK